MKKTIIIYGTILAVLTGLLNFIEYKFLVRDLTMEVYIGALAVFFMVLGIWVGMRLKNRIALKGQAIEMQNSESIDPSARLDEIGISPREYEVLTLIAKGQSNKEIAESLFLSTNTVKTHSSNLFAKLDVKRRTQAVQKAMELGLLPDLNQPD